ncbi:MAG: hypothetical protein II381_09205 [Victivallales bacterium]|nr:hypothetical protein [Victivallales bacterium]
MSWTQIEKLAKAYQKAPGKATAEALDKCLAAFQGPIETFARLFIKPLVGMQDMTARFILSTNGTYPETACQFDESQNAFLLSPIGILSFQDECTNASEALQTQEGRENFKTFRLYAYLKEMQKLPLKYLAFLCLFREVARIMEVTRTDKRRTMHNPPTEAEEAYMSYLWAFKELENAMQKIQSIDLRADYKISWYESEWITVNS